MAWHNVGLRRHYEKKLAARIRQCQSGSLPQRKVKRFPRSLATLLDKYLQHLAVKGFAESTLRVRRVHMEIFLTWCKGVRINAPAKISRTSLENYQRYLFDYSKRDVKPLAVGSQHSPLAPL